MGRPTCGTMGTFSPLIKDKIKEYRPGKEGWGAITIRVELELAPDLSGEKIPSVSTINRHLKQRQRVRPYRMTIKLPGEACIPSTGPHDVWQMDAEGNKQVKDVGTVSMINIKDIFSKTYVQSYPLVLATKYNHPTGLNYQRVLRLAFMEFGRCQKLQVDHESVFYENTRPSPFPTRIHLWVLAMGAQLCHTPKGQPHKQGAVERKHQTMDRQVCQGRTYTDFDQLFAASQKRRARLNYHIPCRMLDQRPPLQVYPKAKHSGRYYDPRKEQELFNQQLIFDYLAKCKWCRNVNDSKGVSLGARYYTLKEAEPNSETKITFNLNTNRFRFCTPDDELITELDPKGLSFKELAGDLDTFIDWVENNPLVIFRQPPEENDDQKADTTF